MSDSLKQDQRAGDHSTNVQAQHVEIQQHIHQGLTLEEARKEFMALFADNFYRLQSLARETAERRAREITERFLADLMQRNPAGLGTAEDPDFQAVLFTAQREYARSGREELSDMLVNLLVERATAEDAGLLRIALNEALTAAAKLTPAQWDALSFLFRVRVGKSRSATTTQDVVEFVDSEVAPYALGSPDNPMDYHHLECVGCVVTDGFMGSSLANRIGEEYRSLFTLGFPYAKFYDAAIPGDDAVNDLLKPNWRDPENQQFVAMDESALIQDCAALGLSHDKIRKLRGLLHLNP